MMFSAGKTVLVHELNYQRRDFSYMGFASKPSLDHTYAIDYTLLVQHVLSPKWTLLAIGSPGIASRLGSWSLDR